MCIKRIFVICIGFGFLTGCASLPATNTLATTNHSAHDAHHPERLVDTLERADLALREARLGDAEVLYVKLTREHPSLPDVWLRLGNIYARQGQYAAAERVYRDGLRHRSEDSRLWNNLALVQVKQAIETLETSSRVLPASDPNVARIQRFHTSLVNAGAPISSQSQQQSKTTNSPERLRKHEDTPASVSAPPNAKAIPAPRSVSSAKSSTHQQQSVQTIPPWGDEEGAQSIEPQTGQGTEAASLSQRVNHTIPTTRSKREPTNRVTSASSTSADTADKYPTVDQGP